MAVFRDLVALSQQISAREDGARTEDLPSITFCVEPGDWVYTTFSGVAEVVEQRGETVVLALIGASGADPICYTSVSLPHIRQTGMQRSC